MTKLEYSEADLITLLLKDDIRRVRDYDTVEAEFEALRINGFRGYNNYDWEELRDEVIDREILSEEDFE